MSEFTYLFRGRETSPSPEQMQKTKLLGAGILAKNCGQTVEKILKDFDRDYWMDAAESIEYGIVDSVLKKL